MVKDISSAAEFRTEINVPYLVVVDFYASWCGPCKMIAPFIEQLSLRYPEVKFLKVNGDNCQDLTMSLGIRAYPTFHFYVNGAKVDEMQGANQKALEDKILQHKTAAPQPFGGKGFTLGATAPAWDGVGLPPGNARDARLKALGHIDAKSSKPNPTPVSVAAPVSAPVAAPKSAQSVATSMEVEGEDDDELAVALALSMSEAKEAEAKSSCNIDLKLSAKEQDIADEAEAENALAKEEADSKNDEWDEEMVPVPVDEKLLSELVEMGFPEVRARKGIVHGKDLEGALLWLTEHLEDADIDQPYMVRKRDTIPKIPLTAEERAAKLEEMKLKVKQRREARAKEEKAEALKREKDRRERGQKMEETAEQRERMMRKRENERIKREKEDEKKERERLRQEIARDKELRKLNKGVIPSVLGVDGYNPSVIQYDQPVKGGVATDSLSSASESKSSGNAVKSAKPTASSTPSSAGGVDMGDSKQKIESSIATIMRYRTAGDGGQALKLLLTFVKNVAENPEEKKYQSINMESKAFKSKLSAILGPLPLLKALGFEKVDGESGESKLVVQSVSIELFRFAVEKLTQADVLYTKQNPY